MSKTPQESSILVVEDDPAIRRLLKMILARTGHNVDVAADGVEAVLKLGLVDFDVIILDLMMPNLDGFSFLKTLADNRPEFLKRVIVTSAASRTLIQQRLEAVPFAVVSKPFSIDAISSLVHDCIEMQERPD